jgi:hypothetical protein
VKFSPAGNDFVPACVAQAGESGRTFVRPFEHSVERNVTRSSSLLLGAATLAAALCGSASAQYWRNDRDAAVQYDPQTGGYCDTRGGCPDHFWTYPIFYGPVYYHHVWYRGPVYTRDDRWGHHLFWVRGDWRRDEWHHARPYWARDVRFGPALDFAYYEGHGFNVEGHWRHERDAWLWSHGQGDHGRYGQSNYGQGGYGGGCGDHDHDWHDRDGHDHDWHDQQGGGDQNNHGGPDQYAQNGSNGSDHGNWNGGNGQSNNGGGNWNGGYNGQNGGDHGNWHHDHGDQSGQNNGPNNGPNNNPQTASNGPAPNKITVTSATYGGSCHVPEGNVTKFLQDACNGQGKCDYVVKYQTIGDPAPGCSKDFSVKWTCSTGPGGAASAAAEAGFGSKVTLDCSGGHG